MAAKTSREVGMPEIVGVSAPSDVHIGKNVPVVNCGDLCSGVGDFLGWLGCVGWIAFFIKVS